MKRDHEVAWLYDSKVTRLSFISLKKLAKSISGDWVHGSSCTDLTLFKGEDSDSERTDQDHGQERAAADFCHDLAWKILSV